MFAQRITPYRLDRPIWLVGLIVFATAGGITQTDPIGGPVAGAGKTLFVHKCFKIMDGMVIDRLPVCGKYLGQLAQYVRSTEFDVYPGQYQKPGIVGQKMNALFSQLLRPADVSVAASDMTWC